MEVEIDIVHTTHCSHVMCIILDLSDDDVTHSRLHTVHIPTQYTSIPRQSQTQFNVYFNPYHFMC